ncbi:MAG: di-trans,poly-cis-decaprenylcistransferase [Nitrospirae bacterium]|nr:di-trans,poly-cis-decaprenylcistransferase [Nitrospirota bacterium]
MPSHVGIIMDGNGRWAELRGLPRIEGHRRGAERAREVIDVSIELGLQCLTLYAFSTENWQRPREEVTMLMRILEIYLRNEFENLSRKNVAFRAIGETWRLPENIQELIRETEENTAGNTGLKLVAALSYSGRNEIIRAIKNAVRAGKNALELNEDEFNAYLDTAGLPHPDLIIRTSGERRLSNFLLWQAAYAELYFSDTLWPDFDRDEFMLAIQDFQGRERRFGRISARNNAP